MFRVGGLKSNVVLRVVEDREERGEVWEHDLGLGPRNAESLLHPPL
jgi:hypothetical protein